MNKRKQTELLQRYLDGEAPPEERVKAERLMEISDRCRRELDFLRQADIQLGRLGLFPVSSAYDRSFREKLKATPPPWPEKRRAAAGSRWLDFILPLTVTRTARAAAAVVLLVGLTVVLPFLTRGTLPRIGTVTGTAHIYRAREAAWTKAAAGMTVRAGDILRTAGASSLELTSAGRYTLRISGDSELVVRQVVPSRRRGTTVLTLETGVILARTGDEFEGSVLSIDTPLGRSVVRGTAFRLEVGPGGMTGLSVADGRVELISYYRQDNLPATVEVKGGWRSVLREESYPEKPRRMTAGQMKALSDELEDLAEKPAPVAAGEEAALREPFLSLVLSDTPDRVDELLKKPVLFVGPSTPPEVKDLLVRAGDLVRKGDYAGGVSLLRQILDRYPDPRYNSTIELLLGAYYYGLLAKPGQALDVFERVARSGDPRWSSLARIAVARIHERMAEEGYRDVLGMDRAGVDAVKARRRLKKISIETEDAPDQ
ncbi:MAG: FecR family protein [PVC group bacterium]